MANQKIEVGLQEPDALRRNLRLESFDEDNGGASDFTDNQVAFLRFFSDSDENFSAESSFGRASILARKLSYEVSETLTINNASSATLQYMPKFVAFNYRWLGRNQGNVKRDGKTLYFTGAVTGVLQVSYSTTYGLISISIGRIAVDTSTVVVAKQGDEQVVSTVSFSPINSNVSVPEKYTPPPSQPPQTQTQRIDYTLTVKDYITGAVLAGVAVSLNGAAKGTTDANGRIYLGSLAAGNYRLSMTKSGYINSTQDGLNNEYFTVA